MELIELVATNDSYENDAQSGSRVVNPEKLHNIYFELREKVFVGEPIQQNSGDNGIVFRSRRGPNGNYGWQLFRTRMRGTAILEYRGPVSYWPHERLPLPLEKEKYLSEIWVTFHQQEEAVDIARKIIEKHTKKPQALRIPE